MTERCEICHNEVEIPHMSFDSDPEHRGWSNYWTCDCCGLTTVIDETENQLTGESRKDDPVYNYHESGNKRYSLDHDFKGQL